MNMKRRIDGVEQKLESSPQVISQKLALTLEQMLSILPENHRQELEYVYRHPHDSTKHPERPYVNAFFELFCTATDCVLGGKPFPPDGGLSIVEDILRHYT